MSASKACSGSSRMVGGNLGWSHSVEPPNMHGLEVHATTIRGRVLRDEHVEIFANLWLMEVRYAIYNTPRDQRVPHFVMIDELPTFRLSFENITSALAQVRKFLTLLDCRCSPPTPRRWEHD